MEPGEVDCGVVSIPAADLEEAIEKIERYAEYLAKIGSSEATSQLLARLRHARGGKEGVRNELNREAAH